MARPTHKDPSMEDILESIRRIVIAEETKPKATKAVPEPTDQAQKSDVSALLVEELNPSIQHPETQTQKESSAVQEKPKTKEPTFEAPAQKVISGYNPPKINKIQIGGKSDLTMSLKAEQRREQSPAIQEDPIAEDVAVGGNLGAPEEERNPSNGEDSDILDLTQLVHLEAVASTKGVWERKETQVEDRPDNPITQLESSRPSAELLEQRAYQKHLEDQIREALNLENYVEPSDLPATEKARSNEETSDDLSESLDSYIRELVQERVQHWLDSSLEALVEKIVREEIRAALKRPKK